MGPVSPYQWRCSRRSGPLPSIGSSIRLADLAPERFGVFVEGEADEAWLRLIAKAQAIAADETAGPEDVIALAEDADALADAVPPQAKGLVVVIFQMVLLALVVDLMKDGIKAGGTMLLPYLMAVPLMFQPPIPPALPPAPAPFSAPMLPQRARRCARHPAHVGDRRPSRHHPSGWTGGRTAHG